MRAIWLVALAIFLVANHSPVYAITPGAPIEDASLHSDDSNVIHVDPDLEEDGRQQTYLISTGAEIDFDLDVSATGVDLFDSFTIELTGATFPADSYENTRVDGTTESDGDCVITWVTTEIASGEISGQIDCRGPDGIDDSSTIPLVVAAPATGSAIITITVAGAAFSAFMFVAEPGDEILVGMDPVTGGDAECPTPDFSTDAGAQGSIESALEAAFLAVDDADDVIVICDVTGEYTYSDSFKPYDLTADGWSDFYPSIAVRAETVGGVTLDGAWQRFFSTVGADLSLSGINFVHGSIDALDELESYELAPISVTEGDLRLNHIGLMDNVGLFAGGATVIRGNLIANNLDAQGNFAYYGGALSVINAPLNDTDFATIPTDTSMRVDNGVFINNCSTNGGNALFSFLNSRVDLIRLVVTNNQPCGDFVFGGAGSQTYGGGAVFILAGDVRVVGGTFSANKSNIWEFIDEPDWQSEGGALSFQSCALISEGFPAETEEVPASLCDSPSLAVTGATFESNESLHGGAISLRGVEATFSSTRFGRDVQSSCGVTPKVGYANEASYGGGAIFAEDSNLTVRSSQFYRNCGWGYADGGAISAVDGDLRVTGSTFSANSAESGGAVYHASATPAPYSTVLIEQNQFLGNLANTDWGQGGAVRISVANSKTTLVANVFTANRAGQGGAVSLNDGFGDGYQDPLAYRWRVERNTFSNNVAAQNGGGLHMALDNSGYVILNGVRRNTFSRNSALAGGAVVVESDSGSERQILTRFQRALRDNRFAGNRATRARNTADIGVHFD